MPSRCATPTACWTRQGIFLCSPNSYLLLRFAGLIPPELENLAALEELVLSGPELNGESFPLDFGMKPTPRRG